MELFSSAFLNNQNLPAKYTCDGEGINPPLSITEVPENAASLALIADDPDAPSGVWTHWLMWNIAPETKEINEGEVPEGAIEGKNSSNELGYEGACPPKGTHRYIFTLYALDFVPDLPEGATRGELESAISGHIIGQAEIVSLYAR